MFRKLLKIAGILVLVIFIIVTLAFTASECNDVVCNNIKIEFDSNELIQVNKDELIRLVNTADNDVLTKKLTEINAELIEQAVEKHEAVLNAEVYTVIGKDSSSYKGVLAVKVKHRKPVVRIMSESAGYYLDEFGGKIPISSNYTANVLVTTGYFSEKFAVEQLLPFVLFVEDDDFWKAQIEQVHIQKNGEVLLTPLVGEHIIEFGNLNDYQEKLKKMKAFYEQVLAKNSWNKYKQISLKYNDQVIAKKR
jgi:cell division protein FtsQ